MCVAGTEAETCMAFYVLKQHYIFTSPQIFFVFYVIILLEQSKKVPGLVTTQCLHRVAGKELKICPLLQVGFGHMQMQMIYAWGRGRGDQGHLMWITSVTRDGLQQKLSGDHSYLSGTNSTYHIDCFLLQTSDSSSPEYFSLVVGMCSAYVWDRQQMTGC